MMDIINELYDLCETIEQEIKGANEKIRTGGGKLTAGDVDYIDKLTHTMKSIKCVIGMLEDDGGYSGRGGSYDDGMAMNGRSYARGGRSYRGSSYAGRRNASRDSMGRYSGNGYSRDSGDLVDELREMMSDAPEQLKGDIKRLISKAEQM